MAQQIELSTDKSRVSVAPGASTELCVTVQNLSALLDEAVITVAGVDAGWVQVIPSSLPVFAQQEASARVIVQPPANSAQAVAGVYRLTITGRFRELSGQEAAAQADLEIQFAGDYRIEIGKGRASSEQEAVFPITVHNEANAALSLRFTGQDAGGQFWYKFDPFLVTAPPGGAANALLTIRARSAPAANQQAMFTVEAQGEWRMNGLNALPAPGRQVAGVWSWAPPAPTPPALPPSGLRLTAEPAVIEHPSTGLYQLQVENPGGNPVTVALEGSSPGDLLNFRFDPTLIALAPQSRGQARLSLWPAAPSGSAAQRQVMDFRITARALHSDIRPATAKVVFVRLNPTPVRPPAPPQKSAWPRAAIALALIVSFLCLAALVLMLVFRQ